MQALEAAVSRPDNSSLTRTKRILLLSVLLGFVYGPLILNGGFIIDDWKTVEIGIMNLDFLVNLRFWFDGGAKSPVSMVGFAIESWLFKDQAALYAIVNFVLFSLSGLVFANVVSCRLGSRTAWLFLGFYLFPTIASTGVIAKSSGLVIAVSALLWGLSLRVLLPGNSRGPYLSLGASAILVVLSLLTYEVFYPLIVFNIFLAFENFKKAEHGERLKGLVSCVLTPVFVFLASLFAALVIQRILLSIFPTSSDRIKPASLAAALYYFPRYFYSIIPEAPMLCVSGIFRLIKVRAIAELGLLAALSFLFVRYLPENGQQETPETNVRSKVTIGLAICSLTCAGSIFFLSQYPPVILGIGNRLMFSTSVIVSLCLAQILGSRKSGVFSLVAALTLLGVTASFLVQRNAYFDAWNTQIKVLADFALRVEERRLGASDSIIANVPRVTQSNFADETVFCWDFDFNAAGRVATDFKVDSRFLETNFSPSCKSFCSPDYFQKNPSPWYYEYDLSASRSTLKKVQGIEDLREIIDEANRRKVNFLYPHVLKDIRSDLKSFF